MRRRVAAPLALAVLACLGPTAYAASSRDPVLRSRPADVALAKRLVLGRADLPGSFGDAGADTTNSGSDIQCAGVVQPDLHRLVMSADVTSHGFDQTDPVLGYTHLRSEVSLFHAAGDAQASIAWIVGLSHAKLESCFAAAFRSGLPKAAKLSGFRLTSLVRTAGDLHVYVWEMRAQVLASGRVLPVDFALTGYRRGRALEMFMAVNAGAGLDPNLMEQLSRALSARLVQASL